MGGHFFSQALRLFGNLLLTRLLVPEMFGVMAIATVFISGLHLFSDIGLSQLVIQSKRGEDQDFLNTVWTIQIVRGCCIAIAALCVVVGIAWAAAHAWVPVNSTYANPQLPWVLGILSMTAVISGCDSTKMMIASRSLNLARKISIELIGQVVGLVCMLLWAWKSPTISALLAGAVVSTLARTILSHILIPGKTNRFRWDSTAIKEIFGFGRWLFLTSIMWFLISNEDRMLLGWFFPPESLGIYSIAALLAAAPRDVISKLVATVIYPALSEARREHPEKLNDLYYKIRFPIDAVCLGIMGFLITAGETIIKILYNSRYYGAGEMLEILALMLFSTRYGIVLQLCMASGKPQVMARSLIIRLISTSLCIFLGFHFWGILGAVWGVSLAGIPELIYVLSVQRALGLFHWKKELKALTFLLLSMGIGFVVSSLH